MSTLIACIILAAGKGQRMKSDLPKVMQLAAGRSLVGHVIEAAKDAGAQEIAVVTSPASDAVKEVARRHFAAAKTVVQHPAQGTGDAVKFAEPLVRKFVGTVIVLFGADPLVTPQTIKQLADVIDGGAGLAVLGFRAEDPTGYGRLLTNAAETTVHSIREHADATMQERNINLCNSGVMAFRSDLLWQLLPQLTNDNAKNEYYLTDCVSLANARGETVGLVTCDEDEVLGVNTRAELAAVEAVFQRRYRERAMEGGATLIAPETVFLSADTTIGQDVTIEPHVFIGPGVSIGNGSTIFGFSHIEQTEIGPNCQIGPYARLRPGARLEKDAKVGNFVEIKNAVLEEGAKANHLSYIGDARVGAKANVGAGTITCNYDGFLKHHTDIGAGAFIGSNSALVAPVKIGEGAYIGSGSVVTRNVQADALALTRANQEEREGWAARYNAAGAERKKRAKAKKKD